jgi:uncharacterized membrane protein
VPLRKSPAEHGHAAKWKFEKTDLETIDAILRFEKQNEQALAPHHRVLHAIGGFVGTVNFIFLQLVAVGIWFGFNLIFPNRAIDEFPFPLLATVLALEAVLLTSCNTSQADHCSDRPMRREGVW